MNLGEGSALPFFMGIWMTCFSLPAWTRQLGLRSVCVLALGVLGHASALALTAEQTQALTLGDTDARVTALQKAALTAAGKTLPVY